MFTGDDQALVPGAAVGPATVVKKLAGGGMSVLYEATMPGGDEVVVKVLRPSLAHRRGAVERFLQEARMAAGFEHRHVVRVMDVGELGSGVPFLIMERLVGEDLSEVLARRGRLDPQEAVSLLLQACEGISVAHKAGIVHRDIKPSNLFLHRPPVGSEVLKVLDFGIAKATTGEGPALTSSDMVMGSAPYMSPEQLLSTRDVDARTDIWALGVVLFQMLTGQLPFSADTPSGTGALILHAATPSARLSTPRVSPSLDAVIARCLEKSKTRRYPSLVELTEALRSADTRGVSAASDAVGRLRRGPAPDDVTEANLPVESRSGVAPPATHHRLPWILGAAALLAALAAQPLIARGPASLASPPSVALLPPVEVPPAPVEAARPAASAPAAAEQPVPPSVQPLSAPLAPTAPARGGRSKPAPAASAKLAAGPPPSTLATIAESPFPPPDSSALLRYRK